MNKDYDSVNHPKHYTSHPSGIECIQITEHLSFTIGNAIKYLWRADEKGGVEDLQKAVWYINREISKREQAKQEASVDLLAKHLTFIEQMKKEGELYKYNLITAGAGGGFVLDEQISPQKPLSTGEKAVAKVLNQHFNSELKDKPDA